MAGMSINSIKSRIKSVSNTRQITRAMELVSSSKLRRAKECAEGSRPFHAALTDAIADLMAASGACDGDSVFLRERKVKKTCFVVIAGDRGLAGAYNSNLFRHTEALSRGLDFCVLPIGKKAVDYFHRRGAACIDVDCPTLASADVGVCSSIASILCNAYKKGEIDRVVVIYTKFVSMLSQVTADEQILPVEMPESGAHEVREYTIDADPVELIDAMVPFCVSGLLYAAVAEATASEHGARRNAMSSASKNAGELIDTLQLRFNRARQAAITQEISEIVSGADAL